MLTVDTACTVDSHRQEAGYSCCAGKFSSPITFATGCRSAAIPHHDAGDENALNGAVVQVYWNLMGKNRLSSVLSRIDQLYSPERSSVMWMPRNHVLMK